MVPRPQWFLAAILLHLPAVSQAQTGGLPHGSEISAATRDADGVLVHQVQSEYQRGTTSIRVLLPQVYDASRKHRVLYVLEPLEIGDTRLGEGLAEIRKDDLHNKHQLICVTPTYTLRPWYADHPTDKSIRHESYLQEVVVPFIDGAYSTDASANGRLLVGYSKSGYGAVSLLLRFPETYGRAAAFDASFSNTAAPERALATFGDQANYERHRITRELLERRLDELKKAPRLCLVGYANVRDHHAALHRELEDLGIPHGYFNDVRRTHRWDSGWLPEAIDWLAAPNHPPAE